MKHDPKGMVRVRVRYALAWTNHVMNIHLAPNTDAATALNAVNNVLGQMKQLLCTDEQFYAADLIPAGTNIGNPLAGFQPVLGVGNAANRPANAAAGVVTFVGRTVAGTKARLFIFSDELNLDRNYRIDPAEWTPLAAITSWMNSTACPLVALDGLAPVWKTYANFSPHKHWVRKLRQGAG